MTPANFRTVAGELIRVQESPIHGWGGFATVSVRRGTRVIEYVGEKIDKHESNRRLSLDNQFIFFLGEDLNLDGSVDWNRARFLNHSCAPNCDAELIDGRVWIIANRDIRAGEELTFNYGYDLDDYRAHPCRCGAPNCPGYIVAPEFAENVRAREQDRKPLPV
ncbi:MAG TPA: SET domain-containing protein-lysine N-methyltransferase [Verrucomicrobiae bacterium]